MLFVQQIHKSFSLIDEQETKDIVLMMSQVVNWHSSLLPGGV
jgi:hypothetical protein